MAPRRRSGSSWSCCGASCGCTLAVVSTVPLAALQYAFFSGYIASDSILLGLKLKQVAFAVQSTPIGSQQTSTQKAPAATTSEAPPSKPARRAAPGVCDIDLDPETGRAPYAVGEWTEIEPGLTYPSSPGYLNLSDAGVEVGEKLKRWYARCEKHTRGCLWRPPSRLMGENGVTRVVESMNWRWTPKTCSLQPFPLEEIPERLEALHAKLWFVGDSLNDDMATQLICYLQGAGIREDLVRRIQAVRMDHLGTLAKERSWASLGLTQNDIVVVNAGAHWWSPVDGAASAFRNSSQMLLQVNPRAVIFRTTVMGHFHCNQFLTPFKSLTPENRSMLTKKYNWKNFDRLNKAITAAFQAYWPVDRFFVLDVSMFELRGDGHAAGEDCLHYCVPGAPMEWNRLLAHVLHVSGHLPKPISAAHNQH